MPGRRNRPVGNQAAIKHRATLIISLVNQCCSDFLAAWINKFCKQTVWSWATFCAVVRNFLRTRLYVNTNKVCTDLSTGFSTANCATICLKCRLKSCAVLHKNLSAVGNFTRPSRTRLIFKPRVSKCRIYSHQASVLPGLWRITYM